MSRHLIETLESALAGLAQEVHKDASVLVQFAAGDWHKIKEALRLARAALDQPATPPKPAGITLQPAADDPPPAPPAPVAPVPQAPAAPARGGRAAPR